MKRQNVDPAITEACQPIASAPTARCGAPRRAGRFDRRRQTASAVEIEPVRHFRLRARELREIADQFSVPSAQDRLRSLAARCDGLADEAAAAAVKDSKVRPPRRRWG